jgi:endopolyphosphatase
VAFFSPVLLNFKFTSSQRVNRPTRVLATTIIVMMMRGWWSGMAASLALQGCLKYALALSTASQVQQLPFGGLKGQMQRPLHGRFLHFTDMHPDIFYTPGTSINDACHKSDGFQDEAEPLKHKKGKKERKDRVGHWGAAVSVCDSPKHLIEATLDWLGENWMADSSLPSEVDGGKGVDFIIWTGDTARHDIDFTHPRSAKEIFDYQQWALDLVEKHFPGVPIVPNLGNNDIIPHNIMFPGPNSMTKAYAAMWEKHIPASEQETVQKGGYFAKEVIEGELAVLSLNTLYWFDNNAAVRGCKGKHDPGTLQLDWMEETLEKYRDEKIQVHLMGHVPPTSSSYFENCYERYTDMALRYQDTIVGQHYGHANIDAWFIQRNVMSKHDMLAEDSDVGELNLDDYSTFFISPSVVPTYLPSVRVWTYNTTSPLSDVSRSASRPSIEKKKKKHVKLPRYTSPDSPSRKNTYLTPLGYSQWVLDLDKANRRYRKETDAGKPHTGLHYQLEYTTYQASTLWSQYLGPEEGKREHVPVPKHLLDRELVRLDVPPPEIYKSQQISAKAVVKVPKKVQHLTRYGLSSCTVDEMLSWAKRMPSCKKLLSHTTKKGKYSRAGYCRLKKNAGFQYRNSDVE